MGISVEQRKEKRKPSERETSNFPGKYSNFEYLIAVMDIRLGLIAVFSLADWLMNFVLVFSLEMK